MLHDNSAKGAEQMEHENAFKPKSARELAMRLEIHYTPKHGSWLDIAEIEIGVLSKQCLRRRIPSLPDLNREIYAWETLHNKESRFRSRKADLLWVFLVPSISLMPTSSKVRKIPETLIRPEHIEIVKDQSVTDEKSVYKGKLALRKILCKLEFSSDKKLGNFLDLQRKSKDWICS